MNTKTGISFALFLVGAAHLLGANWIYTYSEEDNAGQITDGVWTFNATVKTETTNLTVGKFIDYPENVSTLDFSKSVIDSEGTIYTIVTLNPQFSTTTETWKTISGTTAGQKIGELILPSEGLTSISDGAFGACNALTNIINFLPDSVTSLGQASFMNCSNVNGSLRAKNVNYFNRCAFYGCSKLKEVIIGSGVRTISNGSNKQGAFQNCTGLTNIVFEADCHDIVLKGYAFSGKIKLTKPLILNGVIKVNENAFANMVNIESITFDKCIQTISNDVFKSGEHPTNLKEIHFLGAPPSNTYDVEFFGEISTKITTYVPHRYGDEWKKYSATGEIDLKTTTFSSEYVANPELRPLLWGDSIDATTIIIR